MNSATAEILHRHGGAILTSHWTEGSFRQTRTRPIPPDCKTVSAQLINQLPEPAKTTAQKLLTKHPRARFVIAYIKPQ